MGSINIRLQVRDRDLTNFLRAQGYATFDQLKDLFFPSVDSCSKRLRALEATDYIQSRTAIQFFRGNKVFTPLLLGLNIHPLTKIYSLSKTYRRQVPETNRLLKYHMCLHQLLLNDARSKLTSLMLGEDLVLNDPDLKLWSIVDSGRRKEFTPDLTFELKEGALAIELERTLKSENRYAERLGFFQHSSYSHVLYLYCNENHLPTLLRYAGSTRKIAFAHYLDPQRVFSNTWGHMPLVAWINKVTSVKS